MEKIDFKNLLPGSKFNGVIYANNTIYIGGKEYKDVNLQDLIQSLINLYIENVPEQYKENYRNLVSFLDLESINGKNFKDFKRAISISANWAQDVDVYPDLKTLFEEEIKF